MARTTHRRAPSAGPAKASTARYRRTAFWATAGGLALVGVLALGSADPAENLSAPGVEAPSMAASGQASAAGVVVEGSQISMGRVPLGVTVVPTWTLTNTTPSPITLGVPHATVVEGCCPGPLTLAVSELSAGASTTLEFPLLMHAGMDGPHDFAVHVPVGDSSEVLTLRVTGDFGG